MPSSIALLLIVALIFSLAFSVVFLYRIIGAAFSSQLRQKISSKPFVHFLMFCAIPLSIGLVILIHPAWLKRHEERKIAFERVKQAGGWDALKKDCLILAKQQTNYEHGDLIWLRYNTNFPPLPSAIAALKPFQVRCNPSEPVPVVRIHVVGHHSTDFAWPEYWLWFVCGETPDNYSPKLGFHSGWFRTTIQKLTNSVFEVTY